jgi:FKBP-type peptidyl-prolyl cis-trans isomerase SlpA
MSHGIRPGDRVTLHYRLSCGGEEVVSTFDDAPETFALGSGELEPRLEALLLGLAAGAHRVLELGPGEAFGDRDPNLLQHLPRADFPPSLQPVPGNQADFPLPNGQTFTATILAVDDQRVELDFNHPLAGLPLTFEVRILAVEPA